MLYSSGCQSLLPHVLLSVMTLLGYNHQIKVASGTSAGSYTPARCFNPPMHWDTNVVINTVAKDGWVFTLRACKT